MNIEYVIRVTLSQWAAEVDDDPLSRTDLGLAQLRRRHTVRRAVWGAAALLVLVCAVLLVV